MKNKYITYGFLAVMLIALISLAYLQYHWLGSVSEGERTRLEESLQASSENFASDYDQLFSDLTANFQVRITDADEEISTSLEEAYANWKLNAEYPELVDSVYVVTQFDTEDPLVYSFKPTQSKLVKGGVTEGVYQWLEGTTQNEHERRVVRLRNQVFLGNPSYLPVPVQLLNVVVDTKDGGSSRPVQVNLQHLSKVVLLRLNDRVLKEEVIPTLAKTYFSESFDDQYYVLIKDAKKPLETYYSSSANIPEALKPDIKVSLNDQGISSYMLFNFFEEGDLSLTSNSINPQLSDITANYDRLKSETSNMQQMISVRGNSSVKIKSYSDSISNRYSYTVGAGRSSNIPSSFFANDSSLIASVTDQAGLGFQDTELWLTSKAGSLDSFVAQTRAKNLGISFFILFILGISGGLIVMYSQRTQTLADQQMLFVAGVSHELRTPLSVIRSAAENMSHGVVSTQEKQKEYADLMLKEGLRLSDMVDHIMEYSGIQSGKKVYHFMNVDAHSFFENTIENLDSSIKDTGYTIDHTIDPDLRSIDIDQDAINLCVSNLINNAIKFSTEPHRILMNVERAILNNKPAFELSVTDKGIGISDEEQKSVFEPFFRGKIPLDEQIKGNGIGLSLVKKVVEAHKGILKVKSIKDEGTTFTMVIPTTNDAI